MLTRSCFPMLPHYLPCRGSRGAATLPHRLPLRSIPPPRFACGASHSRGTWASTVCAEEFPTPLEMSLHGLHLLGQSKSLGPSAPIAYATSVSPLDEAVPWPWCTGIRWVIRLSPGRDAGVWCWIWLLPAPVHRSCKSPRARILVLGTSGAHWPARWPRFELTERADKS